MGLVYTLVPLSDLPLGETCQTWPDQAELQRHLSYSFAAESAGGRRHCFRMLCGTAGAGPQPAAFASQLGDPGARQAGAAMTVDAGLPYVGQALG